MLPCLLWSLTLLQPRGLIVRRPIIRQLLVVAGRDMLEDFRLEVSKREKAAAAFLDEDDSLLTIRLNFRCRTQRVLVPADGTTDALYEAASQRWGHHGELSLILRGIRLRHGAPLEQRLEREKVMVFASQLPGENTFQDTYGTPSPGAGAGPSPVLQAMQKAIKAPPASPPPSFAPWSSSVAPASEPTEPSSQEQPAPAEAWPGTHDAVPSSRFDTRPQVWRQGKDEAQLTEVVATANEGRRGLQRFATKAFGLAKISAPVLIVAIVASALLGSVLRAAALLPSVAALDAALTALNAATEAALASSTLRPAV